MKFFNLLVLLLCFSFQSFARSTTEADAGFAVLSLQESTTVSEAGTSTTEFHGHYKILSEAGVQAFAVYRIPYNANTTEVRLGEITVSNDGTAVSVDPKTIEDKTLFSGLSGYDESKTWIIPLPQLRVGSEIKLNYEFRVNKPSFPGVVSERDMLSFETPVQNFLYSVTLPKSVKYALHDPAGVFADALKVEEQGATQIITLTKTNLPGIGFTNEPNAMSPSHLLAWFEYSNLKSFEDAGALFRQGYEKALKEEVPAELLTLFGDKPAEPLKEKEAAQRLQDTLRKLAQSYRYFGDWRTVEGAFVPRSLQAISKTGYGDCKDFTLLVMALSRHLGLESEAVWINRSEDDYQKLTLPHLATFNHSIARITIPGTTRAWWIDATNPLPHLGLIPSDIANRQALVLSAPSRIELVPFDAETESVQVMKQSSRLLNDRDMTYDFKIRFTGHMGWLIQTDFYGKSPERVNEFLTRYLGIATADMHDFKVMSLTQESVWPFAVDVSLSVAESNAVFRSGSLKILPVNNFGDAPFRITSVKTENRISDLNLGFPRTMKTTQSFGSADLKEVLGVPEGCNIQSPWFDLQRQITKTDAGLSVEDVYSVKTDRVKNADLKTPVFKTLQDNINNCIRGVRIVTK